MKRLKIVKNVLFFNETSENYGKRLCHRRDFSTFPCMMERGDNKYLLAIYRENKGEQKCIRY